jgi:hypothetical protein
MPARRGRPRARPGGRATGAAAGVTKAYNPETAVFGPLPRWRSEDGNFNFGGGAMMQFDFGTYGQNAQGGPATSQALNPDLEPGIRARRGILLASGLIYDDFIVFAAHDAFDPGDAPMDGLRSAVLAYRRFDPLWFVGGEDDEVIVDQPARQQDPAPRPEPGLEVGVERLAGLRPALCVLAVGAEVELHHRAAAEVEGAVLRAPAR